MATSAPLNDAQIMHQIDLLRYSSGRARSLLPFLREMASYLDKRISSEGESIRSRARLNALIKDTNARMNSIYSKWEREEFTPILRDTTRQELEFQKEATDAVVVDYSSGLPAQKQVLAAASANPLLIGSGGGSVDFSSYTTNWKPEEIKRVANRISAGFFGGQTTSEITRGVVGLRSQNFADGILNMSRANIQGMVRNTITHMSVYAKDEFNKENDDLIIGYRIIATLDARTSQVCRFQDQQVYLDVNGPNQPRPPFHHGGCRTTTAPELNPEFDFLRERSTRPAVTDNAEGGAVAEQVSTETSYYTWLKAQPASVANRALGYEQARVFRNSGLSPDEFRKASVNRFGQPISLEQMANSNAQIAEYLNRL